jgi:hypothetical protein
MVWAPVPLLDAALPLKYSPRRENLRTDQFFTNLLQATAVVDARSGGESPPEAFFITIVASGVMCE